MPIPKRWQDHIEAWQGSGLKQADYCRQHAISHKTFAARLSEYRRTDGKEKPVLIPATVTEGNGIEPEPEARPLVLILRQGHRLELPGTVSASWLSALLRSLA
jgi:hypothetical protein